MAQNSHTSYAGMMRARRNTGDEQQFLASLTSHISHHGHLHGYHIPGQEVRRKTVKVLKGKREKSDHGGGLWWDQHHASVAQDYFFTNMNSPHAVVPAAGKEDHR